MNNPKLSPEARQGLLRRQLQQHGPLYVAAVVPDYARHDFELDQYGAWYVAHTDLAQLDDDVVNRHLQSFLQECPDVASADLMERFMAWLEGQAGYIVLHTAGEGVVMLETEDQEESGQ